MSNNNDFKDLADRAYVSYHQDGIIDILLGAGITGFGLQMLFDSSALIVLSWMPFLFYMPLKNHITAPRFGYVRFKGEQEGRTRNTRMILIGLLTLTAFVGLFLFMAFNQVTPEVRELIGENVMLILGGLAALIMAAAAAATGLKRFYIYAVLTLLFNAAGTFLPVHEGLTTVLLGLTILAIGIWMLARFVRAYPLPEEESK